MAQLSHEAAKVAFQASTEAEIDLCFGAFTPLRAKEIGKRKRAPGQMNSHGHQPTMLDYETLDCLDAISRRVGWIALKVEKNPTSPRVSSKRAYDLIAYDAMLLRLRYQPASFRRSGVKIEYLLTLLDQIASYYEQNKQPETLRALSGRKGS